MDSGLAGSRPRSGMTRPLMPLEILHRALVLLRRRARCKSAEIAPPAGLRILLARVEPVFAGSKLADHGVFIVRGHRLNKQRRDCRFRLASSVGPSRRVHKMKAAEPVGPAAPFDRRLRTLTRWASSACAPGPDGSRAGTPGRRTSDGTGRSGRARSPDRILRRPCSSGFRCCRQGRGRCPRWRR
jgi:hypothetical protein